MVPQSWTSSYCGVFGSPMEIRINSFPDNVVSDAINQFFKASQIKLVTVDRLELIDGCNRRLLVIIVEHITLEKQEDIIRGRCGRGEFGFGSWDACADKGKHVGSSQTVGL